MNEYVGLTLNILDYICIWLIDIHLDRWTDAAGGGIRSISIADIKNMIEYVELSIWRRQEYLSIYPPIYICMQYIYSYICIYLCVCVYLYLSLYAIYV